MITRRDLSLTGYGEGDECSSGRHNQEITVPSPFRSSRDVIIRTDKWAEATTFYESVLGLPIVHRSETLIGFETGAFCLYVEQGEEHGPVFEFLVPDIQAAKRGLLNGLAECWDASGYAAPVRA